MDLIIRLDDARLSSCLKITTEPSINWTKWEGNTLALSLYAALKRAEKAEAENERLKGVVEEYKTELRRTENACVQWMEQNRILKRAINESPRWTLREGDSKDSPLYDGMKVSDGGDRAEDLLRRITEKEKK